VRFWVNGRLVDESEATLSVLDHGFTVGDGVFETLKIVSGPAGEALPFALDRHLARLGVSASGLGLREPDRDTLAAAVRSVCQANPELAKGGRLRITYTSGAGPLGSDRGSAPTTLVVSASAATRWPSATRLAVSPWSRNERGPLTGLKTTSYAENVAMLAHAKGLGADEALIANLAGDLCEGTGSNTFVLHDGVISTPPLSSGCLAGITRQLAIEWCREAGIDVTEVDVSMAAVRMMDEIFVTSSTRDIHPVVEVLDASGASTWQRPVGPVTLAAAEVFRRRAGESWNP
jgi:branched-chain amino acid aminotransferase